MANQTHLNSNLHAEPEYLKSNKAQIIEEFTLKVEKFTKGKCFICAMQCDLDAFCHIACAIAYEDYKKELLKRMWEKEK